MQKEELQKLIELVLGNEKVSGSGSTVYRDEPIIGRASQMGSYMPPKYAEMKKVFHDYAYRSGPTSIFVRQAKLMEDFEDDFDFHGTFSRYYPTYQAMNDNQLRGYFSWRTKYRRGEISDTQESFLYVYIYELLNLVGAASPGEAFGKLTAVYRDYREKYPSLEKYMPLWFGDFAAYHNLDRSVLDGLVDSGFEDRFFLLDSPREAEDGELFSALGSMSTYDPERSRGYKDNPEYFTAGLCRCYRAIYDYYEKNRQQSLTARLFGQLYDSPYRMFNGAVFEDKLSTSPERAAYRYELADRLVYVCGGGQWRKTAFRGERKKSPRLGAVIKAVDYNIRLRTGSKFPLSEPELPRYIIEIIEKELDSLDRERRQAAKKEITIDLSCLGRIRLESEETRDKLIVEEETEEGFTAEEPAGEQPAEPVPEPETDTAGDCPLSGAELELVKCLLDGGDYTAVQRGSGIPVSVIADSVNELMFDFFGDTVIDFDGERPELIEDYIDEMKGIIYR